MSDTPDDTLERILASLGAYRMEFDRIFILPEVDELGCGGYGTVKLGQLRDGDGRAMALVAVKILRPPGRNRSNRTTAASRLAREARVWAGLIHPNILHLVGFCLSKGADEAWLISPYEPLGNLADYMSKETLDLDRKLDLILGAASGLLYLHTREVIIIHGDLKPANIIIGQDGCAKLCDFGLAKALDDPTGLTSTITIRGSPRYMSPELFQPEGSLTTYSDIWAFGCLGGEVFSGLVPYYKELSQYRLMLLIMNGEKPFALHDPDLPTEALTAIENCWKVIAAERPPMSVVCEIFTLLQSKKVSPSPHRIHPSHTKTFRAPGTRDEDLPGTLYPGAPSNMDQFHPPHPDNSYPSHSTRNFAPNPPMNGGVPPSDSLYPVVSKQQPNQPMPGGSNMIAGISYPYDPSLGHGTQSWQEGRDPFDPGPKTYEQLEENRYGVYGSHLPRPQPQPYWAQSQQPQRSDQPNQPYQIDDQATNHALTQMSYYSPAMQQHSYEPPPQQTPSALQPSQYPQPLSVPTNQPGYIQPGPNLQQLSQPWTQGSGGIDDEKRDPNPRTPRDQEGGPSRKRKRADSKEAMLAPPLVDDVGNRDSFLLFNQGWILPSGTRRVRRKQPTSPSAPTGRKSLTHKPSKLSVASTSSANNETLRAQEADQALYDTSSRLATSHPPKLLESSVQEESPLHLHVPNVEAQSRTTAEVEEAAVEVQVQQAEMDVEDPQPEDASRADSVVSDLSSLPEMDPGPNRCPLIKDYVELPPATAEVGGNVEIAPRADSVMSDLSSLPDKDPGPSHCPSIKEHVELPPATAEVGASVEIDPGVEVAVEVEVEDAEVHDIDAPRPDGGEKFEVKPSAPIYESGLLVWAKSLTFPFFPAVVCEEDEDDIPVNVHASKAQSEEALAPEERPLTLVRFYDNTSSWGWIAPSRIKMLGDDPDIDHWMLNVQKFETPSIKSSCRKAYNRALAEMEGPEDLEPAPS